MKQYDNSDSVEDARGNEQFGEQRSQRTNYNFNLAVAPDTNREFRMVQFSALSRVVNQKKSYFIVIFAFYVAIFTSCKKDGIENNTGQLLEIMTTSDRSYLKFEYDEQNRIKKTSYYYDGSISETKSFTYNGNDLVKIVTNGVDFPEYEQEITKSGNKITIRRKLSNNLELVRIIDLSSDGLPIKYVQGSFGTNNFNYQFTNGFNYQFQNGNLIRYSQTWGDTADTPIEYKYDTHKSPFYNCNTPRWFLFMDYLDESSLNNAIEALYQTSNYKSVEKMEYVYDRAGFPTERKTIRELKSDDGGIWGKSVDITYFKYK